VGSIFDSHPRVLYKHQPLFSYRFKNALNAHSSKEEIDAFFSKVVSTPDSFIDREEAKAKGLVPNFPKHKIEIADDWILVYKENRNHHILTNLLEKEDTIKIIGLVRNPLSVISSWLKAPKEFRKEENWKIEEEWRFAPKKNLNAPEEFYGYEKWKEVVILFERLQARYPNQFYLLHYDDLLQHKMETITNIFSFCNLDVPQQTTDFIHQSSSVKQVDAYSVFKEKKNDDGWKQDLPEYIIEAITTDPVFLELNKKYNWI